MAITDPDILVLFEDWLEELEAEVVGLARTRGAPGPMTWPRASGFRGEGQSFSFPSSPVRESSE